MMSGIIRITKNLSFNDLLSGSIAPVDAYRTQVHDWILSPARRLTEAYPEDTDHGMALLALELMFFEPHPWRMLDERSSDRMVAGLKVVKQDLLTHTALQHSKERTGS
jgi:hypothetical protein